MRLSRVILNFFVFFLQENFTTTKSTKIHTNEQKQKRQHFYAHKKHLTEESHLFACMRFCAFYFLFIYLFILLFMLFMLIKNI